MKPIDSVRFCIFANESVKLTDSVRFAANGGITDVAVTRSVNDTDSVRFCNHSNYSVKLTVAVRFAANR